MKNYKNNNNEIYSYEDEVSKDFLDAKIKELGLTPISDDEIESISKAKEDAYKATNVYKISEAKQYLNDTDYKVLPDYDGNTDGIIEARAEARATIRSIEAE